MSYDRIQDLGGCVANKSIANLKQMDDPHHIRWLWLCGNDVVQNNASSVTSCQADCAAETAASVGKCANSPISGLGQGNGCLQQMLTNFVAIMQECHLL